MVENTYEVLEFHLSRELPRSGAFVLAITGTGFLFFSFVSSSGISVLVSLVLSLFSFFLAAILYTFKSTVRMDNRNGTIEKHLSTFIWKKNRKFTIAEFTGVGIGMAGGSTGSGVTSRGRYFIQLLGQTIVNIPGSSSDMKGITELADRIGIYLSLPVDKKPRLPFFQRRMGW